MNLREKIYKILTRNDTGETKSHQSGITIPRNVALTGVFPKMGVESLNPRTSVTFYDENDALWTFQYIYYNDIYFGKPRNKAHNEYRLTCVKDFIAKYKARSGDEIWFGIDDNGVRRIGIERKSYEQSTNITRDSSGVTVIKLGQNWRSIKI